MAASWDRWGWVRLGSAGAYAHGYGELDGRTVDLSHIDPSMAGAAGGGALVTTVQDLSGFLDSLLAGRLFSKRDTLRQMLTFLPAPDEGGSIERPQNRRVTR